MLKFAYLAAENKVGALQNLQGLLTVGESLENESVEPWLNRGDLDCQFLRAGEFVVVFLPCHTMVHSPS